MSVVATAEGADRELVTKLAQLALERVAPEELLLFDELSAEYFEDPERAVAGGRREEAVAFGLDLALMTPYLLATVTAVVQFLVKTVAETVGGDARPVVVRLVRRLYREQEPAGPAPSGPGSSEPAPVGDVVERRRIHEVAVTDALKLGLSQERAELLAASIVGSLAIAD
jgi:hypothetical protein